MLRRVLLCCVAQQQQDLMRNACDVTNVVEAANTDGRQDRLENMLAQLEQCQKALQVRVGRAVWLTCVGFSFKLACECSVATTLQRSP